MTLDAEVLSRLWDAAGPAAPFVVLAAVFAALVAMAPVDAEWDWALPLGVGLVTVPMLLWSRGSALQVMPSASPADQPTIAVLLGSRVLGAETGVVVALVLVDAAPSTSVPRGETSPERETGGRWSRALPNSSRALVSGEEVQVWRPLLRLSHPGGSFVPGVTLA